MFWDYPSQNPKPIHQVMVLMGDWGIPDAYRFMHRSLNQTCPKNGQWVYCQLHMKSQRGTKPITQEDSAN
jgi:catalase